MFGFRLSHPIASVSRALTVLAATLLPLVSVLDLDGRSGKSPRREDQTVSSALYAVSTSSSTVRTDGSTPIAEPHVAGITFSGSPPENGVQTKASDAESNLKLAQPCLKMLERTVESYLKVTHFDHTASKLDNFATAFRSHWEQFRRSDRQSLHAFAGSSNKGQELESHIETLARMFEQLSQAMRDHEKLLEDNERVFREGGTPDFSLSKVTAVMDARLRLKKAWNALRTFYWRSGTSSIKEQLNGPTFYWLEGPLLATLAKDDDVSDITRFIAPDPDFPLECLILNFVGTPEEAAEWSRKSTDHMKNMGKPSYEQFDNEAYQRTHFSVTRGATIFGVRLKGTEKWTGVNDWKSLAKSANKLLAQSEAPTLVEVLVGRVKSSAKTVVLQSW